MSETLKIRLVGADSYTFRKKKYLRGRLYEVDIDTADALLERESDNGERYFSLPHERETKGERVHRPQASTVAEKSGSKDDNTKQARKAGKKKTLHVGGGKVTSEGEGAGSDEEEEGDSGDGGDGSVEV